MFGLIFGFLGRLLIGALLFSLVFAFFSLAVSLRLMPRLIEGGRRVVRAVLILSYRFYHMTFVRLQPFVLYHLGLDILSGYSRLAMCIVFSLVIATLPLIFVDASLGIWILGLSVLHGLFVGLAWDDIENPGGIQLGAER